jgi:murein DD-endopeptidase MepM/ murein hydrolase activator NlpD
MRPDAALMLVVLAGAITAAWIRPSTDAHAGLAEPTATSTTSATETLPTAQAPAVAEAEAIPSEAVFRLPFDSAPGPDTWLLLQPYGNTSFAYQYRSAIYHAGQGLHFGVDFAARCGTPVVAIGDGIVSSADNIYHGAAPHNLMINHSNGLASFYGHLLSAPFVKAGDEVVAGQVVGLTGDPDLTCTSRPHLHLEIRDAPAHRRAFDPLPLIDADWDRITLAGGMAVTFEQDLADPRRWQYIGEQPAVIFGQPLVNGYDAAWP